MRYTEMLSVRVDPETMRMVKGMAAQTGRSVADVLRLLVKGAAGQIYSAPVVPPPLDAFPQDWESRLEELEVADDEQQ